MIWEEVRFYLVTALAYVVIALVLVLLVIGAWVTIVCVFLYCGWQGVRALLFGEIPD